MHLCFVTVIMVSVMCNDLAVTIVLKIELCETLLLGDPVHHANNDLKTVLQEVLMILFPFHGPAWDVAAFFTYINGFNNQLNQQQLTRCGGCGN